MTICYIVANSGSEDVKLSQLSLSLSLIFLFFGPYRSCSTTSDKLDNLMKNIIVKVHPTPMELISGNAPAVALTAIKHLTKFSAAVAEAF